MKRFKPRRSVDIRQKKFNFGFFSNNKFFRSRRSNAKPKAKNYSKVAPIHSKPPKFRKKDTKKIDPKIDHRMTLEYISTDTELANFTREMIKNEPESYTSQLSLLSNYFNILHLALLQIAIPSLAYSPVVLLILLIALELFFIVLTIYPFFFHSKFISWFELIVRILKCLFMVIFLTACLFISLSSSKQKMPVSKTLQNVGIFAISAGIFLFFVVILVKGVHTGAEYMKEWCCSRGEKNQKSKNKINAEGEIVYQKGLVFYKIEKEEKREQEQQPNDCLGGIMSGASSRRDELEPTPKKINLIQKPKNSKKRKSQERESDYFSFLSKNSSDNDSGDKMAQQLTKKRKKSKFKAKKKNKKKGKKIHLSKVSDDKGTDKRRPMPKKKLKGIMELISLDNQVSPKKQIFTKKK